MEENSQPENINQGTPTQPQNFNYTVGQNPKKPKVNRLVFVILALLILVGGGIFFLSRRAQDGIDAEISPTPFFNETFEEEPMPEPSPEETVLPADKEDVSISIQNGTGISGEAAYLQNQLKSLGYSDFTLGNASSEDHSATEVTFNSSLSSSVVSEITAKLRELYQEVETKTTSTGSDVLIITGLKKGATAQPAASPSATPISSSPSPTP